MAAKRTKQPEVRYPDPLPPPPERSDAQTQQLVQEQRSKYSRKGRAATMLMGSGAGSAAPGATASHALRMLSGAP